jgi:serine phosphatase RsbU (regulator of sigma subunit)
MELKKNYRKAFWKSLPTRSYIKLLIAIFFTLSTIGFIIDLWNAGQQPLWRLLVTIIYFGLLGVGCAHIAIRRDWKIIPVLILVQISIMFLLPESNIQIPINDLLKNRLILDGFGLVVSVVLGYVFFILFISGEGIPQVRLKTEIDLAKKMHDVLVPTIQFQNENIVVYGKSIPTSEIGGDLIDLYDTENTIICYTADVSGHGVAAGLLMGMFKSAMHTALKNELSLSKIVNTINQSLHKLKKASMFLTVSAICFYENKTAEFTVAGHLPILHFQAHSNSVQHLLIEQIPLTVKPDYLFKTKKVNFESGDIFLFLTDGLTEVSNSRNEEFGIKRIEELLIQNYSQQPDTLFNRIMNEIKNHGPQYDDQTLLIIYCQ